MSLHLQQEIVRVFCDALHEINEMLGYEYFESSKIDKLAAKFLKALPSVEALLKSRRGVTLRDVEKEKYDYEKAKAMAIRGIFHAYILKEYKGTSFEEKFKDYLYSSGTEKCEWIGETDYASYFNAVINQISNLVKNKDATKFIIDYLNKNPNTRSQAIMTLFTNPNFFKDSPNIDEKIIDDHIGISKSLSGVAEKLFKLTFAIINNYWTMRTPPNLDKKDFFEVWKGVKKDPAFSILTKAVPDTIVWNASKHAGYTKLVGSKKVKFNANEGTISLTYSDFISRVRELYACTLALAKISLMIMFNLRNFLYL